MCYRKIFCWLILINLLLSVYAYSDNNILTNPGFERGKEGWADRTCAIEIVKSPVRSGECAVKVINRLANWQGVKQSVYEKMVDGKTYKLSGWVRLDNAKSDLVALTVEQQDDAGTKYIGIANCTANDTGWTYLSGEFTLKITGILSVLDVYFEGPAPGVNFYVDDAVAFGPEADAPVVIPAKPKGTVSIDVKKRYQMIEGFGGSAAYYTWNLVSHKRKNEIYNLLFKDLDIDILRIRNNYDIDSIDMYTSIEIIKEGKKLCGDKLKILLNSWGPPAYLKNNNNLIGGTLKKVNGKFVYDEFAHWWCNSIKAYRDAGVTVDYITIQNELDYEAPWTSCKFSASESIDTNFAAFNKALTAVYQKLKITFGENLPKILIPESSGLGNSKDYIENLDDLSIVHGFAHHLYDCSGCGSAPDRFIPRMLTYKELAEKHGNKPIFQTEFEEEPGTWSDALNTALTMHNSLTIEGVSSYLYWDLFWETGTGLISMTSDSTFIVVPTYYAFKQFSAFVDYGWHRVEATTDNTGIRISAYISPDNKKLSVIIINTTKDTNVSLKLNLKNFKIKCGEIYRSSEKENCELVDKLKDKTLQIPANSITTLVLSRKI